jgi:chloride channel 3/4/5
MASPVSNQFERTESIESSLSIAASTSTEVPSGPLSGPSDTTWRRQRLLHIGSVQTLSTELEDQDAGEATPIVHHHPGTQKPRSSYGTIPHVNLKQRRRLGLPALSASRLPSRVPSPSNSPTRGYGTLDRSSIFRSRPISAYDAAFGALVRKPGAPDVDSDTERVVRANGIRVWYSSFSSIDWLHDAIKDSMRMYRLRRHKSLRGRLHNAADRLMGWVIVTIVGFLTAIAAFLIVRSEQWLFDIKYGYCTTGWWKARRFCCQAMLEERKFAPGASSETCVAWVSWGDALVEAGATQLSRTLVGRTTYALLAVRHNSTFLSSCRVL